MNASRPFVILGGGGHAGVVIDLLRNAGRNVEGVLSPGRPTFTAEVPWLGGDEIGLKMTPAVRWLANGLGSIGRPRGRAKLQEMYEAAGFDFPPLIHTAATVADNIILGSGSQIMAGAIVQTETQIGHRVIINTGAVVDHGCRLGDDVHIAPGAILSGDVIIGRESHVGVGAIIIQGVEVGEGAMIAAGAVVTMNVAAGTRVMGVPARIK